MKKILSFLLCLVLLIPSLVGCSKPPEFSEIEARLAELIEASAGVNEIIFGKGLETYERLYDPLDSLNYYEDTENDKRYYYYSIEDGEREILAYRTRSYGTDFSYLELVNAAELGEGTEYVYFDSKNDIYYVPLPDYEEKTAEFYYNSSFPEDYDVVRLDSEYLSVSAIKEYAEGVYSSGYLASLYETLFVGAVISPDSNNGYLTARYIEYCDDNGTTWLMASNRYEPLITEKRIFDLSTATVLKGSNAEFVRIDIETYLESAPENRLTVTVSLIKENGEWFLDSGTY